MGAFKSYRIKVGRGIALWLRPSALYPASGVRPGPSNLTASKRTHTVCERLARALVRCVWCVPLAARPKRESAYKTMPRKKTETPAIEVKAVPRVETLAVKVDASEALKQFEAAHVRLEPRPVSLGDIVLCRPFAHEPETLGVMLVTHATTRIQHGLLEHGVAGTAFVHARGPVTMAAVMPMHDSDPGPAYAPCAWTVPGLAWN